MTRIIVPFGAGAGSGVPFGQNVTHVGEYVWHCHILEHEDNEVMLPYEVVGSPDARPMRPRFPGSMPCGRVPVGTSDATLAADAADFGSSSNSDV